MGLRPDKIEAILKTTGRSTDRQVRQPILVGMQTTGDLGFAIEHGSAAILGAADRQSYLLRVLLFNPFLLSATFCKIDIGNCQGSVREHHTLTSIQYLCGRRDLKVRIRREKEGFASIV